MRSGHCAMLMLNLVPHEFMHLVFFPAVTLSESSSVITSCPRFTQLLFCFSPYLLWGFVFWVGWLVGWFGFGGFFGVQWILSCTLNSN